MHRTLLRRNPGAERVFLSGAKDLNYQGATPTFAATGASVNQDFTYKSGDVPYPPWTVCKRLKFKRVCCSEKKRICDKTCMGGAGRNSRQSARTEDQPEAIYRRIAAHTGLSAAGARSKNTSHVVYGRSGAHTLAKIIATLT